MASESEHGRDLYSVLATLCPAPERHGSTHEQATERKRLFGRDSGWIAVSASDADRSRRPLWHPLTGRGKLIFCAFFFCVLCSLSSLQGRRGKDWCLSLTRFRTCEHHEQTLIAKALHNHPGVNGCASTTTQGVNTCTYIKFPQCARAVGLVTLGRDTGECTKAGERVWWSECMWWSGCMWCGVGACGVE